MWSVCFLAIILSSVSLEPGSFRASATRRLACLIVVAGSAVTMAAFTAAADLYRAFSFCWTPPRHRGPRRPPSASGCDRLTIHTVIHSQHGLRHSFHTATAARSRAGKIPRKHPTRTLVTPTPEQLQNKRRISKLFELLGNTLICFLARVGKAGWKLSRLNGEDEATAGSQLAQFSTGIRRVVH